MNGLIFDQIMRLNLYPVMTVSQIKLFSENDYPPLSTLQCRKALELNYFGDV